jgi:hypothetical protein
VTSSHVRNLGPEQAGNHLPRDSPAVEMMTDAAYSDPRGGLLRSAMPSDTAADDL